MPRTPLLADLHLCVALYPSHQASCSSHDRKGLGETEEMTLWAEQQREGGGPEAAE